MPEDAGRPATLNRIRGFYCPDRCQTCGDARFVPLKQLPMNDYRNSTEIGAGGQRTFPAAAYLSAALFEREMRQLFHNDWLCVAREQDVPAAGSFITRQIGCESVVIVRDHEQHIRAHFNICRHRGTQLCDAAAGQLGRTIQCPYHAWTYALNGELVGVPDESQLAAFDRREFGLHPVACHVWGGFVWLSLAREPQPFTESHAAIIARCKPWSLDSLVRLGQRTYQVQANWKLIVQNYSECYHCAPVHPTLVKLSPSTSGGNDLVEGAIQGGFMEIGAAYCSLTTDGRRCALPIVDPAGEHARRAYYYVLFPHMMLALLPDYVMVHTLWPQSSSLTVIECQWLFHSQMQGSRQVSSAEGVAGEAESPPGGECLDPERGIEFWDRVNQEDWHVSELTQQGVRSSRYEPGPYSDREAMSASIDRHYLNRMGGMRNDK